jgi:hypothetical protein
MESIVRIPEILPVNSGFSSSSEGVSAVGFSFSLSTYATKLSTSSDVVLMSFVYFTIGSIAWTIPYNINAAEMHQSRVLNSFFFFMNIC